MTVACCPTCKRKLPAPRAPKMSPQLAAFLKFKPATLVRAWEGPEGWKAVEDAMSPAARAQFSYGRTGSLKVAPDAAVMMGARDV